MNSLVRSFATVLVIGVTASAGAAEARDTIRVNLHLDPPRGFEIRPIGVWREKDGSVAVHGWVCRQMHGSPTPSAMRIEKVDAEGRQVAVEQAKMIASSAIHGECIIYRATPTWPVSSGDALRVCAAWGEKPCEHTERR